jgi:hypothetical protein
VDTSTAEERLRNSCCVNDWEGVVKASDDEEVIFDEHGFLCVEEGCTKNWDLPKPPTLAHA